MGERSTLEAEQCLNMAGVPVYTYPDEFGRCFEGDGKLQKSSNAVSI